MTSLGKAGFLFAMLVFCAPLMAAQEVVKAIEQTTEVDVEVRLMEAERRLAEAARQVADLSMAQLPRVERLERVIRSSRGPALGVTIGTNDDGSGANSGPVEGVEILGVSPGGAAEEAGLRAGDVIVSINRESLTAANSEEANTKLLDFMQGVETGDTLDVEYLRNGKSAATEVMPRPIAGNMFAFGFDGGDFSMPGVPVAPNAPHFNKFVWTTSSGGFGDMELVRLTERLGRYFGTDEGLLVVRAPDGDDLQLEDGDVILNIDGRTPTSVAHAMRILGSYESGEDLKLEIMRDKRKREIALTIPEHGKRQSSNWPVQAPGAQPVIRQKVVVRQK